MKFGATLREKAAMFLADGIPLRAHVNYKAMKKLLSRLAASADAEAQASLRAEFDRMYHSEYAKVKTYMNALGGEGIGHATSALLEPCESKDELGPPSLSSSGFESAGPNEVERGDAIASVKQSLNAINVPLSARVAYVELQRTAFDKISKKRDKTELYIRMNEKVLRKQGLLPVHAADVSQASALGQSVVEDNAKRRSTTARCPRKTGSTSVAMPSAAVR